jgi:hypothetical protein
VELKYICLLGTIKKLKGIAFAINPAMAGLRQVGPRHGQYGSKDIFLNAQGILSKTTGKKE